MRTISSRVVAGLVPATPIIHALRINVRGRRDKPGDNAGHHSYAADRPPVARDFALNMTSDWCLFQIFFNAASCVRAPLPVI